MPIIIHIAATASNARIIGTFFRTINMVPIAADRYIVDPIDKSTIPDIITIAAPTLNAKTGAALWRIENKFFTVIKLLVVIPKNAVTRIRMITNPYFIRNSFTFVSFFILFYASTPTDAAISSSCVAVYGSSAVTFPLCKTRYLWHTLMISSISDIITSTAAPC